MKNILHRNHATTSFASAFATAASAYSTTLVFNTRDEYLVWVKQWKEDYKLVLRNHRINIFVFRRDHCVLESKKLHYQKRLDTILTPSAEETVKYNATISRLVSQLGLPSWFSGAYWCLIGLLVLRKAGKLRAAQKREERIAAEKLAI